MPTSLTAEINPSLEDAPALKSLVDYWKSKCPPGDIPNRSDIDPIDLKPHLGSLFIVEPLLDGKDFRYRLIGAGLSAIHGKEFTGSTVRELMWGISDADADAMINAYQIVVRKRVVLRAGGTVLWAKKDFLKFDSVHLPMYSPDGANVWLLGKMILLTKLDHQLSVQ